MNADQKQSSGKPADCAASPGSAAKLQSGGAPVSDRASSTGNASTSAAPPRKQTLPVAQQSVAPSISPASPAARQNSPSGQRPAATPQTADQPQKSPQAQSPPQVRDDNPAASVDKPKRPPRPYFFPAGGVLTRETQLAVDEIVSPCYEQMVMGESEALAKAIGASFTAVTAIVTLDQQRVLDAMLSDTIEPAELEKLLNHQNKSVKQQIALADLILRDKSAKAKLPSFARGPWDPGAKPK